MSAVLETRRRKPRRLEDESEAERDERSSETADSGAREGMPGYLAARNSSRGVLSTTQQEPEEAAEDRHVDTQPEDVAREPAPDTTATDDGSSSDVAGDREAPPRPDLSDQALAAHLSRPSDVTQEGGVVTDLATHPHPLDGSRPPGVGRVMAEREREESAKERNAPEAEQPESEAEAQTIAAAEEENREEEAEEEPGEEAEEEAGEESETQDRQTREQSRADRAKAEEASGADRGAGGRSRAAAGQRRGGAATAMGGGVELEEVEESADADAGALAEEDRGPILVEHPESPFLPSLEVAFTASTTLPPDIIRLIARPGEQAPPASDAEAVGNARRDFERLASAARAQHAEVSAFVRGLADNLLSRYRDVEDGVDPYFSEVGQKLDAQVERAQSQIDQASDEAFLKIEFSSQQATRLVYGAAAWGRNQIKANARTASDQVKQIINELAANYTNLLTEVAGEIKRAGDRAVQSVRTFAASGAENYADTGDPLGDARQEAKRREVPRLTRFVPPIERARDAQAKGYTDAIPRVREQFDQSELGAALHKREREIGTEGEKAIRKAVRQALKSLKEQTRSARKAVREMRDGARGQVAAACRASRARIKGQGTGLFASARGETVGALRGLETASRAGLPAFDNTVRGVEKTLKRAGESGAKPFANAARNAAVDVPRKLSEMSRMQRERLLLSTSGTIASIQLREQQTHAAVDADRDSTETVVNQSSQDSVKLIENAAGEHTEGFSNVAEGVTAAAEQWAMPLAKVFEEAISKTKEQQLEATGEGSFNHWAQETRAGKQRFLDEVTTPYLTPATKFESTLNDAAERVMADVDSRELRLEKAMNAGIIDRVDEEGCTAALRGLTYNQGRALQHKFELKHGSLYDALWEALWDDPDDYNAAVNYLVGNTVEGARYELRASIHWYNDEESRIEDVMRSLTPDELRQLKGSKEGAETLDYVRDHLGGTDLNVFDALEAGNQARADAYRMRDRIDEARRSGDLDALHTVLAEYSRASTYRGWETETADQRRTAVQQELALILQGGGATDPQSTISAEDAAARVEEFALRPVEVQHYAGHGETITITLTVSGANRDLASALIRSGEGSVEARAARLGVEAQRPDKPKVLNLDTALVDPRLNPNNHAPEEERRRAIEDRERMFRIFAERYGGATPGVTADAARALAEQRLRGAMGDDALGADLVGQMVTEEHPTPRTAAMAIMYAGRGAGTNEDLMFRFTERMNRDEIAQMRKDYADPELRRLYPSAGSTGDLDNDLGTFRHKNDWFNELSGDDRLRMERALLGQPRNDRERAEVAAFAAQQQREETGTIGAGLASGSLQDVSLSYHSKELTDAAGASVYIDPDGKPVWSGRGNFDRDGNYIGPNPEAFRSSVRMTQQAAENYAARIDAYANFAATAIAVLGAVAAAVVTVLTAGAASPLLMAAIAGVTGLAAMGARYAISGGRYGWEQAAVDLGMTAVQALTAGVGQSIALASRGGTQALALGMRGFRSVPTSMLGNMGRLTGTAFGDMALMGAATGGLGAFGQTAIDERTWEKGLGHALESLLEGTMRGILSGAATSVVSNAFEAIPVGRAAQGLPRATIGSVMGESTNVLGRGALRGTSSALGAFAGREVELGFDKATGKFKGDAGDIFQSGLEAAGQSFVQDFGAGGIEAPIHRRMQQRSPRPAGEPPEVPRVPRAPGEPETAPTTRPLGEREVTVPRPPAEPEVIAPARPRGEGEVEGVPHRPIPGAEALPTPRIATPEMIPAAARPAPEVAPIPRAPAGAEEIPGARPMPEAGEPSAPARKGEVPPEDLEPGRRPPTIEEPPGPVRPPRDFEEGTSAGIRDSEFHGAAAEPGSPEAVRMRTVKGALRRLLGSGAPEISGARLPNPKDPTRIEVQTASGEKVTVRVRVSSTPLAPKDGVSPVARFYRVKETGEYVIVVSGGAQARHVERALAHELAEIRAGHGRKEQPDVLKAGPRRPVTDAEGRPRALSEADLSPHDRGRLAELGVIAREIKTARTQKERARLMAEAEELAGHLGLGGTGEAADARRDLALKALKNNPDSQALLADAIGQLGTGPARAALAEVAEKSRMAARSGVADEDMLDIPGMPPMRRRPGEPRPGRSEVGETQADAQRISASLRAKARRMFGRALQEALLDPSKHTELTQKTLEYLTPEEVEFVVRTGRLPRGIEFHHLLSVADFPEFAHLAEVGVGLPKDVHRQAAHGGETTREVEAGTFIDPAAEGRPPFHPDPEARKGYRRRDFEVAEGTRTTGNVDRDIQIEQRAQIERLEARADALERNIPRLERHVERLEARVQRIEAELAEARAKGKSEERLEKIEARLDRARAELVDVRERIGSLGRLRQQIADMRAGLAAIAQAAVTTPPGPPPPGSKPPPTPAQPETTPVSPTKPAPEAETPAGPARPPSTEGTAAGIRHSDFRGDVSLPGRAGAAHQGAADVAVSKLVGPEGLLKSVARLPDAGDQSTIKLTTRSGDEVTVKVVMAKDTLPPGKDGLSPVARFRLDETTGQYIIEVSPGALRRHLERALAHELTEIRATHKRTPGPDVLTPGGQPRAVREGELSSLSPHDEGRLAELSVIAKQIESAKTPSERLQLQDDAERLATELGLVGPSQAAAKRRSAALDFPELSPQARAVLAKAITGAERNPFLVRLSGDPTADLDTIRRCLERVDSLDSPDDAAQWRRQVVALAAQVLIDARIVSKGRGGAFADGIGLARFLGLDPTKFTEISSKAADPVTRLFDEARTVAVKGLNDGTMMRSETRRVTPGFEAEFIDEAGKKLPKSRGMRADEDLTPSGSHIDRRVNARKARIEQRDRLIKERNDPKTSPARREQIDLELEKVEARIIEHSEKLGEAAGREFMRQQFPKATELEIGRAGAGVPDLLYETQDGRLVVVECKGGVSPLGVRESADRRFLVQQGTIEYLQSLARTMENSSDPKIRALGERLRTELAKNPPNVDYYLVRQPFNESGDLAPPEVGKFDLTPNKPR